MAARYSDEAIERCRKLYCKYGGQRHDQIEKEMRQLWPGWSKSNLYTTDKGRSKSGRERKSEPGWIEKYGFQESLDRSIAKKPTAALNTAERLVDRVEFVSDILYGKVETKRGETDNDTLKLLRDYLNLQVVTLTKVEGARDTLGAFIGSYERFIDWVADIDAALARKLVKYEAQIIARAEAELGETREMIEGPESDGSIGDQDQGAAGLAGTEDQPAQGG